LVVKEKRGRKRYILFEHTKEVEKNNIKIFLEENSKLINGKVRWKIIKFEKKESIIRIDHKKIIITRNLIEENSDKLGIKPVKTSGTLKALKK